MSFSNRKSGIFFLSALVALSSCSYRVNKESDATQIEFRPSAELVSRVSYADVSQIFQKSCVSCHGAAGGVSLQTYSGARTALEGIYRSTIVEKRMPKDPVPALSEDERLTLWAWIEAGGPEFPKNGNPGNNPEPNPPNPPVPEPTFDSIRVTIFDKKCIFCHRAGGLAERVPLLTREDLLNSPLELVIPGNPEESGLILSVLPDARKPMPPASSGFSPITQDELAVLKEWILQGAKD